MHRRSFLAVTVGTALTAGLAGCTSLLGEQYPEELEDVDPDRELPEPTLGDGDVTVEVYADFTCPSCHSFQADVFPTLESELIEPGEITYRHTDFPIPVEDEAVPMANAARAVQSETTTDDEPAGKFFAYKRVLYENDYTSDEDLATAAADVGVDADVVTGALEGGTYYPTIAADRERGEDAGVGGTPTVLVDGEEVDDPFDIEEIVQTVEDAA
ncbi:DsbA family protein [Natronorubrum texcoconense]|uniref:Thioredoxin n=1 Tax=Natronorubrum texcoconense TaxID=1095776 RepID=A0A1G8XA31_9EURY|nr:thioredoxin domain-containing protein [Natronorubrum texcoconense]SDJ87331.1 Thioredoxin [Natronorubrum texcoconense]